MNSVDFVDPEKVKYIPWMGDPVQYDLALQKLGSKSKEFIVTNPNVAIDFSVILNKIPQTRRCIVWYYNGQWVAKRFTANWVPAYGYHDIQLPHNLVKFNLLWLRNTDLGNITFEEDPYRKYKPSIDESFYELVWYLDPKFNPTDDKIWAVKVKNTSEQCLGIKDMGYLSPAYEIEYNPNLPKLSYDIDFTIPWWDLEFTHKWMLDKQHTENLSKPIWAFQINFCPQPKGIKIVDYVTPEYEIITNPELPSCQYDIEYVTPYYDFEYEHVWMLHSEHCKNAVEPIWAVKIKYLEATTGLKIIDEVSPVLHVELNPELPALEYDIDYSIPYHDLGYEHVWMLDSKHCDNAVEEIWAVSIKAVADTIGTKIIGQASPVPQITLNPELPQLDYDIDYLVPYHDLAYEHVWMLDDKHCETAPDEIWAVKISYTNELQGTKIINSISPVPQIIRNPDLPELDYDIDYTIPYHDFDYEHIWMLDEKHCENAPEPIWAVKVCLTDNPCGSKIVAEVTPTIKIEYNPNLPIMNYNLEYVIPYHDLAYEHVWMLHEKHCETAPEEIWAVKISAVQNATETKIVGSISPIMHYEINKDVQGFNIPLPEPSIQYHDFSYQQIWMLDNNHSGFYDIWAIKGKYVKKPTGTKQSGEVTPQQILVYNKDLKNIPKIKIEYQIPYHDRFYEHVWYLNENFTSGDKVWVAKLTATSTPKGTKEMGVVTPIMPDCLDVFFISYNEPNAETNWKRVLEKAPWAKRINGVKGIFQAHYAAAEQSETDMFYVVDGDAYLVDNWKFNYQPGVFDRDCTYVWKSRNPVNGLCYGYGGVKLFCKKEFLKLKTWNTLDMTTGLISKLCFMQKISNITAFNTDEFSTWKSAFRECVKLKYNAVKEPKNSEHVKRLAKWKTANWKKKKKPPFSQYATDGAIHADQYFQAHSTHEDLLKINDMDWLRQEFNKRYGIKK